MLSPDFLDSDYCYSAEMKRVLKRHQEREIQVIPILLRPVHWQASPLAELQALPRDAQPVTSWVNRDQAFHNIAEGIRRIAEEMLVHENIKLHVYGTDQKLPHGIGTDETTQNNLTSSSVTPHALDSSTISIVAESPSGERFSAEVPLNVTIGKLAADFFESQGWALQDRRGRAQRVVVDLVDPTNPENTKRLNSHSTIADAGIREGNCPGPLGTCQRSRNPVK